MEKKSPFDAVVEEMALHSVLSQEEIADALMGVIEFLQDRAHKTYSEHGEDSEESVAHTHQFLTVVDMVNFYGSALIALDDIEDEKIMN